jgi:PAS domain S-box-containing protein
VDNSAAAGVAANLARTGTGGIALIDAKGQTLAATQGMPPLAGRLREFVSGLTTGERGLLDLYLDTAGRPAMAFAIPVFAVQGNRDAASQIGTVVGVKEVGNELFPLLHQPGETGETALAVLIRPNGAAIEYLSPLPDGKPPLSLRMAANTPELDAAFAIAAPGGFDATRHDYRDRQVLVTSRGFAKVPWTLMYTIERVEALDDAEWRLRLLTGASIAGMAFIAVLLLAVWIYANSLRRAESAARYREMAERSEEQRNLLRLVTDSQPTGIFILDAEGRYRFANREAGRVTGIPADDLVGKPIAHIVGPEAAKRYLTRNREVLESGNPASDVARLTVDGGVRVVQTDHIPVAPSQELPKGVLIVENDITETVTERERRARILNQIVHTLVAVVDRRDPYAANHPARRRSGARDCRRDEPVRARDRHRGDSGKPAQFRQDPGRPGAAHQIRRHARGRPPAGATKHPDQRRAARRRRIRWAGRDDLAAGPGALGWRGNPTGLAGDDILITARVVSVANAFVGMVSKRAYREALDVDGAVGAILDQVGKAFDRRVVVALINYLDNHGGRAQWAASRSAPAKTAWADGRRGDTAGNAYLRYRRHPRPPRPADRAARADCRRCRAFECAAPRARLYRRLHRSRAKLGGGARSAARPAVGRLRDRASPRQPRRHPAAVSR